MTTTIELEVFSCHRVDDSHGNLKVPELQGSAANLNFHKVGLVTSYKWSDMGPPRSRVISPQENPFMFGHLYGGYIYIYNNSIYNVRLWNAPPCNPVDPNFTWSAVSHQVDGHVAVIVPAMSAYVFAPGSRRIFPSAVQEKVMEETQALGCLGFMSGMKWKTTPVIFWGLFHKPL